MYNDFSEAGMHLRSAPGQVEGFHWMGVNNLMQQCQAFIRHGFCTSRACIDMAVQAALVAKVREIDLQGFQLATLQARKAQSIQKR